jgi:ATP-dependent RNA helicase RhlE
MNNKTKSRGEDKTSSARPKRSFSKPKKNYRKTEDNKSSGFSSGGGSRKRFSRSSSRGPLNSNKRFARKSTADISKFVRKATPVEEKKINIKHVFSDFKFSQELNQNLVSKNYKVPTHIQDEAIPYILSGRDVVGLANTGTGKTGAFLLPLIDKVWKDRNNIVLILAPTRELAMQIDREFRGFSRGMKIHSAMCVGGMPIWKQINDLARKPNFIIGTPGRIKDLSGRGKIHYGSIGNIVLDEVDHMLDMGFVEPITLILNNLKKDRQSLFFSATMPSNIKNLITKFTNNPVTVEVASRDNISNIDQDVIKITDQATKFDKLKDILIQPGFDKVLIFTETKRQVDKLSKDLFKDGFKVEAIHGDKRQSQRKKAIDLFERDHVNILVATDVAARGLDIKDITHVINYTIPGTHEDYTHRIGRTGRGNKKGAALTFI